MAHVAMCGKDGNRLGPNLLGRSCADARLAGWAHPALPTPQQQEMAHTHFRARGQAKVLAWSHYNSLVSHGQPVAGQSCCPTAQMGEET